MFMAFVPQFTITTQFFQQKSLGLAIEVQTVRANVGATVSPDVFGGLRDVASGSEAAWKLCGLLCAAAALVAVVLWQAESKQRRSYLRLPAPGNPDFESP